VRRPGRDAAAATAGTRPGCPVPAGGRVDHRYESAVGVDNGGDGESVAGSDLRPGSLVGESCVQAEAVAKDGVHGVDHELHNWLRGVERTSVGAHLAVVALQELLVEVDDRVTTSGAGTELVEDLSMLREN